MKYHWLGNSPAEEQSPDSRLPLDGQQSSGVLHYGVDEGVAEVLPGWLKLHHPLPVTSLLPVQLQVD